MPSNVISIGQGQHHGHSSGRDQGQDRAQGQGQESLSQSSSMPVEGRTPNTTPLQPAFDDHSSFGSGFVVKRADSKPKPSPNFDFDPTNPTNPGSKIKTGTKNTEIRFTTPLADWRKLEIDRWSPSGTP